MAIIKGVLKIIKVTIIVVYKFLKALHLRFVFLVALAGFIMYLAGIFENKSVLIIYIVIAVMSVIFSFYLIGRKKLFKKKKEKNKEEIIELETSTFENNETAEEKENFDRENIKEEKPIFYNVKGKSGYVMAEYSDRYELYKKVNGGLEKIREDKKEEK